MGTQERKISRKGAKSRGGRGGGGGVESRAEEPAAFSTAGPQAQHRLITLLHASRCNLGRPIRHSGNGFSEAEPQGIREEKGKGRKGGRREGINRR